MVRPLPTEDFRALRRVLEPDDYLLSGPDEPPRDLIDQGTWHALWNLPDSVAVDTTNDCGGVLRTLHRLTSAWTATFAPLGLHTRSARSRRPLAVVALELFDAYQAAIVNAMVGFYRVAFMGLRSVVENVTIALELELSDDRVRFAQWKRGDLELKFGNSADRVRQHSPVTELEAAVAKRIGNDLFRQRQPGQKPGHVRMLFSELSKYAHAYPGYTDGVLWRSNGPVFRPRAFIAWANGFGAAFAYATLAIHLGRPTIDQIDDRRYPSLSKLFHAAVSCLAPRAPLRRALRALPARTWAT